MILAAVLALALNAAPPAVPVQAGEAAPFSGVLLTPERAEQLVEEEARLAALEKQLEAEKKVCDAVDAFWRAKYAAQAQRDTEWFNDPEVNRWGGFAVGFIAGLGVMYGGEWLAQSLPGGR